MNMQKKSESQLFNEFVELSEEDFYPPEDNRYIKSGMHDIRGSDNFYEYVELFYKYCSEYSDSNFDF